MIKIKSITMVSACAAIIMTSSPAKALVTLDPGNIAGTIGIVINGATGVMQAVEIITNGSSLLSTIGDAAGTLSKFKDLFGENIQKALQLAQEAQARIQEGKAAYNKYKNEIEARKAKYQALLDQLNPKKENYNDSSETENGGYSEDYSAENDADYDPDTTSTTETSKNDTTAGNSVVDAGPSSGNTTSGSNVVDAGPSSGNTTNGTNSSDLPGIFDAKPGNTTNSANPSTGRQPFASSDDISTEIDLGTPSTPAGAATKAAVDTISSDAATESISPDSATKEPSPKFRISPSKLREPIQLDKISSSELSFTSRQVFAAEISNEKGVNYDSKGTFITPFAKRCDLSVKDLVSYDGMKSCATKIVAENNAKDQEDAINSRKDCETMVYEAVVALLSESTKAKYEASNYTDTLDKQDKLGAESSTIRDDTGVIGMNGEETQKLLNQMNMLESAAILLQGVQQICATSKNILVDSEKSESSNGGQ